MDKVFGLDLGDKEHMVVVLDEENRQWPGERVGNTPEQIRKYFGGRERGVVVIEAGTHSAWVARLLEELGHEVKVANPRKLKLVWASVNKTDERDAAALAMTYRLQPRLLGKVHQRDEQVQADLTLIRARGLLVESRTGLISAVRNHVKGAGVRIPRCSAESFAKRAGEHIPPMLQEPLGGLLVTIAQLNEQIREYDRLIEILSEIRYPQTVWLRQVPGVGPITALSYVLSLEDPARLARSREAGVLFGLTPRRDQSGDCDKQLPITKVGDPTVRRLLVQCAQYMLGHRGPDCLLRRYGERIAARGGKNAKKRAVVAVARKLAVLLHRLWASQSRYEPFYRPGARSAA